jgi:dethiobiotin synthetase
MKKRFFITGTDTDVGKTLCASALLYLAQQRDLSCLGLKPIAAGCEDGHTTAAGELRNTDALSLMQFSSIKLPYEQVNPVVLSAFLSPHIAAERENQQLTVKRLVEGCIPGLETNAQFTLIEGAGGWYVPINSQQTLADFAAQLGAPVILVIALKLGCINHSLLTVEAIERSGLKLAAWIGNTIDPSMQERDRNIATLTDRLNAPCLGVVPRVSCVEQAAPHLDLSPLLV